MLLESGCSSRTSSALRRAAVKNVSRDNVTRRVLPVLRLTTSAAQADFSHQQEPICHGRPAAASTPLTSSVQCLSVIGGTVTDLVSRECHDSVGVRSATPRWTDRSPVSTLPTSGAPRHALRRRLGAREVHPPRQHGVQGRARCDTRCRRAFDRCSALVANKSGWRGQAAR